MDKPLLRCAIKSWSILRNYTSLTTRLCRRGIIPHEHSSIAGNKNTDEKDYDDVKEMPLYDHKKLSKFDENNSHCEFKSAKSYNQIFDLLRDKRYQLDMKEAIAATNAIFYVSKHQRLKPELPLKSREEFIKLCKILNKNIRSVNTNQVIDLLRNLTHPGIRVSGKSMICQSLLQMLRRNINELPLDKIIFLQFVIKNLEQSVLSQALLISFPIVFEARLRQQLPEESFTKLTSAFVYAIDNNLSESSINYIIEMIHFRIGEFKPSNTKLLGMGLLKTSNRSVAFRNTLKRFIELVTGLANEIPFQDLRTVLPMICWHTANESKEHYNANMVEAIVMRVINEDKGFKVAIQTLESLNRIAHSHIPILDYLAVKCFEDSNIIASCQTREISTLLQGFSISDYKPIFWDAMQDMILKHSLWETSTYDKIVNVAYRMDVLDCQDHKLLHEVFKEIKSTNEHVLSEIMMLHRNTKSLNPSYTGPLLDDDTFHSILMQSEEPRLSFPLRGALETALGGPQYVLTNVSSRYKKIIDHVIVMREGGYPVAINLLKDDENTAPKKYLEDMTFPPGSQVVIILDLPTIAYPINSSRMIKDWSRTIRALEGLLYPIVPVFSRLVFRKMPEREQIPYLMQAVKLKCEEMVATAQV